MGDVEIKVGKNSFLSALAFTHKILFLSQNLEILTLSVEYKFLRNRNHIGLIYLLISGLAQSLAFLRCLIKTGGKDGSRCQ